MLSSVPPPPPPSAPTGLPTAPNDVRLIGAERRFQVSFAYYVMALFGVISVLAGSLYLALFVIGCSELAMTLWRPTPKLPATSYNPPIGSQWQTPIRVLRLYLLAREFASYAWGFIVTTIFLGFFIVIMWPRSFGPSNLIVLGFFAGYLGTRPLWYPAAKRLLGQAFKGAKQELARGGPLVRLAGDGIDVFQPVVVLNGSPRNWLWHVAFAEIDELRTLAALDAHAYWQSMMTYDPSLGPRAAYELNQYLLGKTARPAIYQYIAAGLHLLVRGPSVLYLLAYADETGPSAVSGWEHWRAAQAPAQASSGGNLQS